MTAIVLTQRQREEVELRLDNYALEGHEPFGVLHGHILEILDLEDAIGEAENILHVARDAARDARNSHRDGGKLEAAAVQAAAGLVRKLEARR